MANPTMSKKSQSGLSPTLRVKRLFQAVYNSKKGSGRSDDGVARIKVSELISRMAFYYEKIRNSVDYKEDHLLRKNAIQRILKRQIVIEGAISIKELDSRDIAKHLITELIRAGYLPNDVLPETKIDDIGLLISKYLKLRFLSSPYLKEVGSEERGEIAAWLLSVAASDIEEKLGENTSDQVVIDHMYDILTRNVLLPEDSPYLADRDIQIFLAVHRNFLKFDEDMLSYILFKYYNAAWETADDKAIQQAAVDIVSIRRAVLKQLEHPLSAQLNRLASRYTVFFSILIDVISEDPEGVYASFKNDPKAFSRKIKLVCAKRYQAARSKLWRAAIRSIIYIFLTKSVFVLILEVPAIKLFGEEINPVSLAINIAFPALLLFLVVFFTRLPSEANTQKIVEGIEEISFVEKERKEPFKLGRGVKRNVSMNFIFGSLYAITFLTSFGFVIWALTKINFNWVSIIIFLFFLAFVSFFSIRIRKGTKELIILPPKENIFSFFGDFFYVPIIVAGKWLSEKFSHVNVFVFVLDFIIEAPFKIFVELTEEWAKYVKERKDDIV
jgi:hypothetical protein